VRDDRLFPCSFYEERRLALLVVGDEFSDGVLLPSSPGAFCLSAQAYAQGKLLYEPTQSRPKPWHKQCEDQQAHGNRQQKHR
jgi:hypothetical protein